MARPKSKVEPKQVEALASIGCTFPEMELVLGVSSDTLQRRFAAIIKKGRQSFKTSIRRMQFETAQKGNPTMQIWLGKIYLGQSEKTITELTGLDGGAIQLQAEPTYDLSKLTDDELRTLKALTKKAQHEYKVLDVSEATSRKMAEEYLISCKAKDAQEEAKSKGKNPPIENISTNNNIVDAEIVQAEPVKQKSVEPKPEPVQERYDPNKIKVSGGAKVVSKENVGNLSFSDDGVTTPNGNLRTLRIS